MKNFWNKNSKNISQEKKNNIKKVRKQYKKYRESTNIGTVNFKMFGQIKNER